MEAEVLGGFLLTFDPKQMKLIRQKLEEWRYAQDSDGLKQMILDACEDKEVKSEHRVGVMLGDFIAENPELLSNGAKMAGKVFQNFVKRKVTGK